MEFLIVTGLSGAGKSKAICSLEDIGFYCVDNIPAELIPAFYDICASSKKPSKNRAAAVVDVRGGNDFKGLLKALEILKKSDKPYKIMFIEARDDVIVQRYRQTRRKHPLSDAYKGSILDAIAFERTALASLREKADYIIDTSTISSAQLKQRISGIFLENASDSLTISCISFGFKYGIPTEADLVFDARCFPNPYYDLKLRDLTGLDEPVKKFVLENENTKTFIRKVFSLLEFTVPLYGREGKSHLVLAVGCTGGKHRSVAIAQNLYERLSEWGRRARIYHRDVKKR